MLPRKGRSAPRGDAIHRCNDSTLQRFNDMRMILCFLCVLGASICFLQAQPTITSPDPKAGAEMTGTIKEYTAGSTLVLETLAPTEPVQFKLARNVTYADTDGKAIEAVGLTTNRKVRVHYTKVGGDNVADKVTLIGN
jgi:hypothetical protein